jgi:hypothetical protein
VLAALSVLGGHTERFRVGATVAALSSSGISQYLTFFSRIQFNASILVKSKSHHIKSLNFMMFHDEQVNCKNTGALCPLVHPPARSTCFSIIDLIGNLNICVNVFSPFFYLYIYISERTKKTCIFMCQNVRKRRQQTASNRYLHCGWMIQKMRLAHLLL